MADEGSTGSPRDPSRSPEEPSRAKKGWWVLGATALAGALALGSPTVRRLLTVNGVTTGRAPDYPDLQPQVFDDPAEEVFDAAVTACERLGWKVVAEDMVERRIHAEVPVLAAFTGDFDVWLTPSENGAGTRVDARAEAHVRRDLGASARHIRAFQNELAGILAR